MYFSNGNAKQIVASCNAYPLDLFLFKYHLSDSFDNTSWIFGRARGHRPYILFFWDSALLLPSNLLPNSSPQRHQREPDNHPENFPNAPNQRHAQAQLRRQAQQLKQEHMPAFKNPDPGWDEEKRRVDHQRQRHQQKRGQKRLRLPEQVENRINFKRAQDPTHPVQN